MPWCAMTVSLRTRLVRMAAQAEHHQVDLHVATACGHQTCVAPRWARFGHRSVCGQRLAEAFRCSSERPHIAMSGRACLGIMWVIGATVPQVLDSLRIKPARIHRSSSAADSDRSATPGQRAWQ